MHDKFETCQDCPDRTIEPNCHEDCDGYKYRQLIKAKENAARRKDAEFRDAKIRAEFDTQKKIKTGQLCYRKKYK